MDNGNYVIVWCAFVSISQHVIIVLAHCHSNISFDSSVHSSEMTFVTVGQMDGNVANVDDEAVGQKSHRICDDILFAFFYLVCSGQINSRDSCTDKTIIIMMMMLLLLLMSVAQIKTQQKKIIKKNSFWQNILILCFGHYFSGVDFFSPSLVALF